MSGLTEADIEPGYAGGLLRSRWRAKVLEFPRAGCWIGLVLAVGDADGEVSYFSADDGRLVQRVRAHRSGLTKMVAHPKLPLLATAGEDGNVEICNQKGLLEKTLSFGSGCVEDLSWSPDGVYLGVVSESKLSAWNSRTDQQRFFERTEGELFALRWLSSEELLTVEAYGISNWMIATGQRHLEWEHQSSPVAFASSRDGRLLAWGSQDCSLIFWDQATATGFFGNGYCCKPWTLSFNSDATLLAVNSGPDVTVWRFVDGEPVGNEPKYLEFHDDRVRVVKLPPESLF